MKKKTILLSTIVGAILLAAFLKLEPVKELVYGEGWPRRLIGLLLFLVVVGFSIQSLQKSQRFHKEFKAYVDTYDLTPEKLSRLTGFNKYDFSYDGKSLHFEQGTTENRERLLADLRNHFGPIEDK